MNNDSKLMKELLNHLTLSASIITEDINKTVRKHNLTPQQYRVIDIILNFGRAVKAKDINRKTGLLPGSITRICDALESKGYIDRKKNTVDPRAISVTITPTGKRFIDELSQDIHEALNERLKRIGINECEALNKMAVKFASRANIDYKV